MTVTLRDDVASVIEKEVQAGHSPDASTLVNDLLHCLTDPSRARWVATPELEALLLESEDETDATLTHQDFIDIRNRVLAQISEKTE